MKPFDLRLLTFAIIVSLLAMLSMRAEGQTLCTTFGDGFACFEGEDTDPVILRPFGQGLGTQQRPLGEVEPFRFEDYPDTGRFDPTPLPRPDRYLEPLGGQERGSLTAPIAPLAPRYGYGGEGY